MKAIKSVEFNFSIKAGDMLNRNIRRKLKSLDRNIKITVNETEL